MSNLYYTASGNPTPLSRASSVVSRNESLLIQQAFDKLPDPSDVAGGISNFYNDTGTPSALVITSIDPNITALTDGLELVIRAENNSTGPTTVLAGSFPLKQVRSFDGVQLVANDFVAGQFITIRYDSENDWFQYTTNSTKAAQSATASAAAAAGSASSASASASSASTSASNAATSETNAVAAAIAAQGTQVISTSTTSNPIGLGDTTFTTQAGKQFAINVPVIAVDSANAANYIAGTIKSYSGTTLVITGIKTGGSGTIASWNISISGVMGSQGIQGLPGGVTGGNLTGAINEIRGTDITSGPTPDIWTTGNLYRVTSTDPITGFPAAPQAGAERVLWIDSVGTPITSSANLIVEGGSTTLRVNDKVTIRALTTTIFLATIDRGDGTAVTAPPVYPSPRNQFLIPSTQVFTPPITGWYRVTVIGSGGRGGRAYGTTARATGAGAPGKSIKWFYLIAGTGYTFNIASGVANANPNTSSNGTDGFASTFTGPSGVVITANGGKAGVFSQGTVNVTLLGGLGGTATGGDINITGGRGGNITITGSSGTASNIATGAGSVGARDVGYNGGDITFSSSTSTNTVELATGGAGVGGNGGSINFAGATAAAVYRAATGSGGAGGPGTAITSITTNVDALTAGGLNAGYEALSTQATYMMALLGSTAGGVIGKRNPGSTGANPDSLSGAGGAAQIAMDANVNPSVATAIAGFLAGGGGITIAVVDVAHTGLGSRFGGPTGGYTAPTGGSTANGATQSGFGLVEW